MNSQQVIPLHIKQWMQSELQPGLSGLVYDFSAPEQLVSLPEQLVCVTEQIRKCSGAFSKCPGAASKYSGVVSS